MSEISIVFPRSWIGEQGFQHAEVVQTLRHEATGEIMFIAGGVLDDGTNVIGLRWSRGQNLARMSPDTDWKIEQKRAPRMPEYVRTTWEGVLDSMRFGKESADGDERIARMGHDVPVEEKYSAVLHHPALMREAYKRYINHVGTDGREPVPFETFELGTAILAGEL